MILQNHHQEELHSPSQYENAKAIAFVATGAGKAPVLREIFLGQSKLPCALVNDIKTGVSVSWFVDSAVEGLMF